MEFTHYIMYAVAGLLGIAIHNALEMKSIKEKARVANEPFKVLDYLKEDWLSMVVSVLTLCLALLLLGDSGIEKMESFYKDWARLIFASIGYMGDSIASRLFGSISKRINNAIDVKTDIADEKIKLT